MSIGKMVNELEGPGGSNAIAHSFFKRGINSTRGWAMALSKKHIPYEAISKQLSSAISHHGILQRPDTEEPQR